MGFFSFVSEFAGFSTNAVAIDLGTVNTLIAVHGAGIVLNEATAVALSSQDEGVVLAVGNEALECSGRTPTGVILRYPFRDGVIADYSLAEFMIRDFFRTAMKKALGHFMHTSPRVLLCVPACVTEVEKRAVCDAVQRAGARDVVVADEIMASCVGAGCPYNEPVGSFAVDIGGGTTDAGVIVLGGSAVMESIRLGGNHIDNAIKNHIRREHNIIIGNRTAERIKVSLSDDKSDFVHNVTGLCTKSGLPVTKGISNGEIRECITPCINEIVELIKNVLAVTPPELAGDIMRDGVTLCGGGANLAGLSKAITKGTGLKTRVPQNPEECVVKGAMTLLDNIRAGKAVQ